MPAKSKRSKAQKHTVVHCCVRDPFTKRFTKKTVDIFDVDGITADHFEEEVEIEEEIVDLVEDDDIWNEKKSIYLMIIRSFLQINAVVAIVSLNNPTS
jgi:hypothetical protein